MIVSIPDLCTLTYFQYQLLLNAGQKYCRMLPLEHSAILPTFIKLPYSFKTFASSIFKWPLKTDFTVITMDFDCMGNSVDPDQIKMGIYPASAR